MIVSTEIFSVTKRFPLTISRGTSTGSDNLLVTLEHDGIVGMGEMAPTSGGAVAETAHSASEAFARWTPVVETFTPWDWQAIEEALNIAEGKRSNMAARAGLNLAIWDWIGKSCRQPVWRILGLDLTRIPATSITVGINLPEVVRERVKETLLRTGAHHLKVKLGSPDGLDADKAMFTAAQEGAKEVEGQLQTVPTWRVDANGGWNVEGTLAMAEWLAARGAEYIEQPLLRGREALLADLHTHCALPIYADESICIAEDILPVADNIDGINIKLMKCGGISEALRLVSTARSHGLRVMYGCMSETSLAISAAAHIGALADELDLDSHLNLAPDPFCGAEFNDGRVMPGKEPGLGVVRREVN